MRFFLIFLLAAASTATASPYQEPTTEQKLHISHNNAALVSRQDFKNPDDYTPPADESTSSLYPYSSSPDPNNQNDVVASGCSNPKSGKGKSRRDGGFCQNRDTGTTEAVQQELNFGPLFAPKSKYVIQGPCQAPVKFLCCSGLLPIPLGLITGCWLCMRTPSRGGGQTWGKTK